MDSEPLCADDAEAVELLEALAVEGLGPVLVRRLIERFGSWRAARSAAPDDLAAVGLKRSVIDAVRSGARTYDPAEQVRRARDLGLALLPCASPRFPKALRPHADAPLVLYVKGELQERDALAVAVVGTRRASLYGRMQAERLAFELAQAGFTIVSGLARGIDAAAHRGALKAGGRTLAVLGNGLARIYPEEHAGLAEEIAASGALVTELPPDAAPVAANFPPRNRIIAGLSLGVVVVEAPVRSGAVLTARLAGEMGKEVFAVPGDIGRPEARGAHQLIRDGAKLVESAADVIEELGPLECPVRPDGGGAPLTDPRALTLNERERRIYDLLDSSPKDIDHLIRESGLSAANATSTLMVLELKRLAVQLPGKRYARPGVYGAETDTAKRTARAAEDAGSDYNP